MKIEIDFNNPRDKIINAECERVAREFERKSGVSRVKAIWRCYTAKDFNPANPYYVNILDWDYRKQANGGDNFIAYITMEIKNKLIFQCGGAR